MFLLNSIFSTWARLSCPDDHEWLETGYGSKAERAETRQRIANTCRAMGGSVAACTVLDAMVVRESSGDACAVHVIGEDEYGLGPLGLSVGLHLSKWDPYADAMVLKVPEVSAVIAMRIFRRAVTRYRARTWLDVNAVFAGRFHEIGKRETPSGDDFVFCRRLARWDIDCFSDPRGELGQRLGRSPEPGQDAFVMRLFARSLW